MLCHISLPFYVSFSICLSFHNSCVFIFLSAYLSHCLCFICLFVCQSKCLSSQLCVGLPIKMYVFPSVCLGTYQIACVSICLSVYLSKCLCFICLSVCLSKCLSSYLSVCLWLPFHMYFFPYVCQLIKMFFLHVILSKCASFPLSIKMSLYPYVFSSICLPAKISFIPHVCLSKCLKIHLFAFLSAHSP